MYVVSPLATPFPKSLSHIQYPTLHNISHIPFTKSYIAHHAGVNQQLWDLEMD